MRIAVVSALLSFGMLACSGSDTKTPDRITTPRWAFSPWISKDISDRADTDAFIEGFMSRDIPVGTLVLDSPWDVSYTMFQPNPERYPGFGEMVTELRGKDIRTVLWVTQMTNEESFDLETGGDTYDGAALSWQRSKRDGYLVDEGASYLWWKGKGGGIDFYNPEAVEYWHGLQAPLLDLGVAGWKLDFGDSYITSDPVMTAEGPKPHQEYSERYYQDYYEYGVERLGAEEFVTMVRAYDASYQFPGRFFARPEHAPILWMGDNRRDWVGLIDAMDHLFRSAAAGYVVLGTDIGGYLDRDDQQLSVVVPADVEVFNRWTAMGALNPFMQLHGRANLAPWTVEERAEETTANYRYWSHVHEALVPFFYSLAEEAYEGGPNLMLPQGTEAEWPGDYRYMLGEALLVAPVLTATITRDVILPTAGPWFDWWNPSAAPIDGQTLTDVTLPDSRQIPVYVQAGAIIPVRPEAADVGLGPTDVPSVLVWPRDGGSTFSWHHKDGEVVQIDWVDGAAGRQVVFSKVPEDLEVRVWGEAALALSSDAAVGNPAFDAPTGMTVLRLSATDGSVEVAVP